MTAIQSSLSVFLFALSFGLSASARAQTFETCTEANSYFEDLLPPAREDIGFSVPQACVQASQLSLAPVGYYGFCSTDQGTPGRTHPRPCISKKYVSAVHSALVDVTDCFGYEAQLAFAKFNLESALHINAVGAALDVGVGQLTKAAIDEVNFNALDAARRRAARSPLQSCQRILPYITAHGSDKSVRCGFMSLPENPTRNLVYAILLIQQTRKSIDRYWSRLDIKLPASVDAERFKQRLAMLAYNAGAAGTVATVKAYLDQVGSRVNERYLHFESRERFSLPIFIEQNFPVDEGKQYTRKRISRYVRYVIQAARRVEGLAGVPCFTPGTFPPLERGPITYAGAQWKPDQMRVDVMKNMESLINTELTGTCEEKKRAFKKDFLPTGSELADLPAQLQVRYRTLCQ